MIAYLITFLMIVTAFCAGYVLRLAQDLLEAPEDREEGHAPSDWNDRVLPFRR